MPVEDIDLLRAPTCPTNTSEQEWLSAIEAHFLVNYSPILGLLSCLPIRYSCRKGSTGDESHRFCIYYGGG